jgi:serine/threonine protein kinase/tetratricopeptide (TPR) repeat protein
VLVSGTEFFLPRRLLGEFGLSDLTDRSRLEALQITSAGLTLTGDQVGDARYLAPERLAGQAATAASDVYALGVLLLQMSVGDLQRTLADPWVQAVDSQPLRELIAACTSAAPEARPEAAVVAEWLRTFAQAARDAEPTDLSASHASATPAPASADAEASVPALAVGGRIGPYRLLDQLGEGGMGVVYLAEQHTPVQRKVALKVVRTGMMSADVRARFEAERQALALMHHPNVASVFDAGNTQTGQPYFAMEYVQGQDITAHCDRHKLDFQARVGLFLQVCEGVLHAHQKGLVHRDLKPGNILISRAKDQPATVKIIDFGVAKSMSGLLASNPAHTRLGSFVGTPTYSSPEQISGPIANVDTRADIYSLGVVLYELLAGVTPYSEDEINHKTPVELARLLSGEHPPSPLVRYASLSREEEQTIAERRSLSVEEMKSQLGADVSWIVGKCLEVDPEDRYPSVLALENDLHRWLDDKPIEARPATRLYRMRKFVRRHRLGVAAATLGTLTLLTATGVAVDGYARAEKARKEAEMAAEFQAKLMATIDPAAIGIGLRSALVEAVQKHGAERGRDKATIAKSVQQLETSIESVNFTDLAMNQLETNTFKPALASIKNDYSDQPLLQARLRESIAYALLNAGLQQEAFEPLQLALEQRRRLLGADDPSTLDLLRQRGYLHTTMFQLNEADADTQAALSGLRRVLGNDHPDTLRASSQRSMVLARQNKLNQAEALIRETLAVQRRVLGKDHKNTLGSLRSLSHILFLQRKFKEALAHAQEAVTLKQRTQGDNHPDTLESMGEMSLLYWEMGRRAEGEALMRETLEGFRRVSGDEHPNTLAAISNLSNFLVQANRGAEAEAPLRQVLEASRKLYGAGNAETLISQVTLGEALFKNGKSVEAESMLREALAYQRESLGGHHDEWLLTTASKLAYQLNQEGKLNEAEALLRETVEDYRRVFGENNPNTWGAITRLSEMLNATNRSDEAEAALRQLLKAQRAVDGAEKELLFKQTLYFFAAALRNTGKLAEAESAFREVVAFTQSPEGYDPVREAETSATFASVLRGQGKLDEAIAEYRKALAGFRQILGDEHEITFLMTDTLGATLRMKGDISEADALHQQAQQMQRRTPGNTDPDTVTTMRRLMPYDPDTMVLISDAGARAEAQGDLEKAETLLREALAQQRKNFRVNPIGTLITIDRLRGVLVRRGRLSEAAALEKELAKHDWPKPLLRMRSGKR